MTLLYQAGLTVWGWMLAIIAGHHRTNLTPILPLNGSTLWLNTLKAVGSSRIGIWLLWGLGSHQECLISMRLTFLTQKSLNWPQVNRENDHSRYRDRMVEMGPRKSKCLLCLEDRPLPWGVTTVPHALRSSISRVYQHYPTGIFWLLRSYVGACDSLLMDFSAAHPRPCYGKPRTYKGEER